MRDRGRVGTRVVRWWGKVWNWCCIVGGSGIERLLRTGVEELLPLLHPGPFLLCDAHVLMDTSFTGQADYTLDAKNRLTVPARYRGSLEGGLVLAKDIEPCVAIWPTAGYDEFRRAALQDVHPMSQRGRRS